MGLAHHLSALDRQREGADLHGLQLDDQGPALSLNIFSMVQDLIVGMNLPLEAVHIRHPVASAYIVVQIAKTDLTGSSVSFPKSTEIFHKL